MLQINQVEEGQLRSLHGKQGRFCEILFPPKTEMDFVDASLF